MQAPNLVAEESPPKKIRIDSRAHPLYVALMSELRVEFTPPLLVLDTYKKAAAEITVSVTHGDNRSPYQVPLHTNLSKTGRIDVYA